MQIERIMNSKADGWLKKMPDVPDIIRWHFNIINFAERVCKRLYSHSHSSVCRQDNSKRYWRILRKRNLASRNCGGSWPNFKVRNCWYTLGFLVWTGLKCGLWVYVDCVYGVCKGKRQSRSRLRMKDRNYSMLITNYYGPSFLLDFNYRNIKSVSPL